jgi:protein gp37
VFAPVAAYDDNMSTTIEWTDVTWNPIRGCSLVSAGCQNCYAMRQAHRFARPGQPYEGLTELGPHGPRWTGQIRLVPKLLDAPLHWRTPRRIFVNSMSDLFHEEVPDEFIDQVFSVMASAARHMFQVLTKRPERMRQYCLSRAVMPREMFPRLIHRYMDLDRSVEWTKTWPLPNVWLGVSVEDQHTANERISLLLQTPAAVRWISAEPLLGPISFRACLNRLDWVVVGGESGSRARPCDVDWIRSIVQQCQKANVPVLVKQLGAYIVDRNDAGFEGDTETSWPMDTYLDDPLNDWSYQSAAIRLRLRDRKGGDPAEWPQDIRVREYPR